MKPEISKIWEVIEYLKDAVDLLNERDSVEDVSDLLDTIDEILGEE